MESCSPTVSIVGEYWRSSPEVSNSIGGLTAALPPKSRQTTGNLRGCLRSCHPNRHPCRSTSDCPSSPYISSSVPCFSHSTACSPARTPACEAHQHLPGRVLHYAPSNSSWIVSSASKAAISWSLQVHLHSAI